MKEYSFFKVLGIGYALALLLLLWEILDVTLHRAATSMVLPFTAAAIVGFAAYFLFVYFAPERK
ncbi:hypothetical protein HS1genome_1540 [Sulfodiicoccus acidiphilus]|uniref:Uncharacterized protein n=1 Tax=Sulfodiicoccus acidiphilus TaxID=1670455 RepID=A0A348B4P9_9CREN|nr:hypothetical protein HS1genome_1540 [Sulfodiicoccus acidiphilus]GGU00449.1 hypothetical protein GCM10007116_17090 [Sulfodiicoccus acidiphilus]